MSTSVYDQNNIRNICIIAHVDHGKCWLLGTKIRLYDGSLKSVEDIKIGDQVIGLDGKPKKVIKTHNGTGQLYKIEQDNGDNYVTNGKHELVLKFTNVEGIYWTESRKCYKIRYIQDLKILDKQVSLGMKNKATSEAKKQLYKQAEQILANKKMEAGYKKGGDIITISVEDYLKLPNATKRALYGFKQGVEFSKRDIRLDPYMLGLWLGDGTSAESFITSIDQPIIDYIYDYADKNNLHVRIVNDKDGKPLTYCLSGDGSRGGNEFRNCLTHYKLLNNKHIPKDYLYNSREIRLQVLAGLLDTDGYMYHNVFEIMQKSDQLANDIVDLSRSLGFKVSASKVWKTCVKKNGERVTGLYNKVSISGDKLTDVPVILDRKKATTSIKGVDFLITQFSVKPVEIGKYAGFQIEGDGRFLAPDYTVWHNSTMTDTLLTLGGLVSEEDAGQKRLTDGRQDEKDRGITIKSTGVTVGAQLDGKAYKINLIDSPGHCDFSSEVTAAIRVTDGAIVIVDCVEGVCVQTDTVLRQAIAEQVKPILVLNKLDRYFFELNLDAESAYQRMEQIIASVNAIVQTYSKDENLYLSPEKGNVFFTTGLHGWGFGIKQFAEIYSKKSGYTKDKLMNYLWGNYFFDPKTKKIVKDQVGERVFCKLIYQPIYDLFEGTMKGDKEKYMKVLDKFEIKVPEIDKATGEELKEKKLFKTIMKKFVPLLDALVDGIVNHLPSPKVAQKYRVATLYDGPMDDECANAIRECDPKGPLMIYISKLVPTSEGSSRFYAFGRVFSGTVKTGQKVSIMGANYVHGEKNDLFTDKAIQRTAIMLGNKIEPVDYVECGNTVVLVGIDNYMVKSGTITTSDLLYPIKTMKFSVSPVVQVAVEAKNPAEIHKLVEGMKRLSKSDPAVLCYVSENKQHIVAGSGELHVEICINDLRGYMNGAEIKVSDPVVPFKETVTEKSNQVCLAKSPNKHNRIFMIAEPLDPQLVLDIENKKFNIKDLKEVAKYLTTNYKWDPNEARKIWGFGPINEEYNILVDCTKGIDYLNEVKDSIVSTFASTALSGILCGETMRGIKFSILDIKLHQDSVHRGIGQIAPMVKNAMYACVLTAKPALIEPFYLVDIQVPQKMVGTVYSSLSYKRGKVIDEKMIEGTPMTIVKGYLPVLESFGFNGFIREQTQGQAFPQCVFDHWEPMTSDPTDSSSKAVQIVVNSRKRKGLEAEIPPLNRFLDKL
jgi:elongation factor 2